MRWNSTARRCWPVATLGFLALYLTQCATPPGTKGSPKRESVSSLRGHWVHDQKIRATMQEIISSPWPTRDHDPESIQEKQRRRALDDASKLADELAQAGKAIPTFANLSELNEADRRGFQAQAMTLYDQAMALKQYAREDNLEGVQRVLHEIDETCIACHSRFRDVTGTLGPRQANDPRTDDQLITFVNHP